MKTKDKIYIALVLIAVWAAINLLTASVVSASGGVIMEETKLLDMFISLSAVEAILFTVIGALMFAIISFARMIRKGLKEEEDRYGKNKKK